MEKLQIAFIKSEQGVSKKTGKPYIRYSIKTPDGKWYSSFSDLSQIKKGDTIEGIIEANEYNGKIYYNFRFPNQNDLLKKDIDSLKVTVKALIKKVGLTYGDLKEAGMPEPSLKDSPETPEQPNKEEVDKDIKEAFPDAEEVVDNVGNTHDKNEEEDIDLDDIPF